MVIKWAIIIDHERLLHNFYFVDYCIVISHRVSDFINRLCSSEVLSLRMDVLTVMLRMVISADMRTLHAVTYFDILCPNVSVTMAMLDMTLNSLHIEGNGLHNVTDRL